MSMRIAGLALLSAALLFASCKSTEEQPPPEEPPPPAGQTGHDCLEYWGANADLLLPLLNAQKNAHGPQWGPHLADVVVYNALVDLEQDLKTALNGSAAPGPRIPPGTIPPHPDLNVIRDLAILVRSGLSGDEGCGAHPTPPPPPPRLGWLNNLAAGPTPLPVTTKADQLLQALKDALDM